MSAPNPLCYSVVEDEIGERFCAAPCLPNDFMCGEHRRLADEAEQQPPIWWS